MPPTSVLVQQPLLLLEAAEVFQRLVQGDQLALGLCSLVVSVSDVDGTRAGLLDAHDYTAISEMQLRTGSGAYQR